jgi:Xaa-Pro dipeptidase
MPAPIQEIQAALREQGLDGWLFYDHHERDPLAYRVLQFNAPRTPTRRWYYLVPAQGDPQALIHAVEPSMLDALPGEKTKYSGWQSQHDGLVGLLKGCRKVAMQYSPRNAVPYVSMVDAGTIEVIRDLGVEVVTSANLVQYFEARWTDEQLKQHLEAGRRVDAIHQAAFAEIGKKLAAGTAVGEWDIKKFILDRFAAAGLITDHGPIVAVNANASNPHYEPFEGASTSIKMGDTVLIDLWAKLDQPDAVYYDVTWVGNCGPAPDKVVEVFETVRDARDAALTRVQQAVAAGQILHGFEVDDAARGHIKAKGYGEYFVHRTGHNIGRDVHGSGANMDNLETHDERLVIPRTCFSIEPGIYLPDFGIRLEIDCYVADKSAGATGMLQRSLVPICG